MKRLFIIGCPRSGTTMVQQALNRHSQIVIPPETKFFFALFRHPWKCQLRHLQRLNAGPRHPAPNAGAAAARTAAEGRAFYQDLAERYTERLGKRGAVLRRQDPGAHGLRAADSRAVSRRKDPGRVSRRPGRGAESEPHAVDVVRPVREFRRLAVLPARAARARACFGEQLYMARYEDIVARPTRELASMLDFLGLPYEPAVADGYGNTEGIPQREYAWKARALEKIRPNRVGLYQRELTPRQLGILERLGRTTLPALGYPLHTDGTEALPLGFRCRLSFNLSRGLSAACRGMRCFASCSCGRSHAGATTKYARTQ